MPMMIAQLRGVARCGGRGGCLATFNRVSSFSRAYSLGTRSTTPSHVRYLQCTPQRSICSSSKVATSSSTVAKSSLNTPPSDDLFEGVFDIDKELEDINTPLNKGLAQFDPLDEHWDQIETDLRVLLSSKTNLDLRIAIDQILSTNQLPSQGIIKEIFKLSEQFKDCHLALYTIDRISSTKEGKHFLQQNANDIYGDLIRVCWASSKDVSLIRGILDQMKQLGAVQLQSGLRKWLLNAVRHNVELERNKLDLELLDNQLKEYLYVSK